MENCAAIDYLLLRHNQGCEEFQGMCCFNLTANSKIIEGKIKQIHDLANGIKEREGFNLEWSWLTSWLPDFSWLKQLFVVIIMIVLVIIVTCVIIQCLPMVQSRCETNKYYNHPI